MSKTWYAFFVLKVNAPHCSNNKGIEFPNIVLIRVNQKLLDLQNPYAIQTIEKINDKNNLKIKTSKANENQNKANKSL